MDGISISEIHAILDWAGSCIERESSCHAMVRPHRDEEEDDGQVFVPFGV